jgi:hypothetical protein
VSEPPDPEDASDGRRSLSLARIAVVLAPLALAGLLVLFVHLRREPGSKGSQEAASSVLSHVTHEDGAVVVTLAAEAVERAGLRTEPLEQTSYQRRVRGYGTVVDLHDLLALRDRYAAAEGKATAARARAAASRREFERLRGLYRDDRNVSATALEGAKATATVDRAEEKASTDPVHALAALARQDLGLVLGGWVTAGSPELDRLIAGRDALIRVALPPDVVPTTPPGTASIVADGVPSISARFVSRAVRTDPRIQGLSLYYLAAAHPGLVANRNVVAILPLGQPVAGARVPESAVVWLDGSAWVYVSRGEASYTRHELQTDRPVPDGYVVTDLAPGTEIVVRGAVLLLSEEFRAAHPQQRTEEEDTD